MTSRHGSAYTGGGWLGAAGEHSGGYGRRFLRRGADSAAAATQAETVEAAEGGGFG